MPRSLRCRAVCSARLRRGRKRAAADTASFQSSNCVSADKTRILSAAGKIDRVAFLVIGAGGGDNRATRAARRSMGHSAASGRLTLAGPAPRVSPGPGLRNDRRAFRPSSARFYAACRHSHGRRYKSGAPFPCALDNAAATGWPNLTQPAADEAQLAGVRAGVNSGSLRYYRERSHNRFDSQCRGFPHVRRFPQVWNFSQDHHIGQRLSLFSPFCVPYVLFVNC